MIGNDFSKHPIFAGLIGLPLLSKGLLGSQWYSKSAADARLGQSLLDSNSEFTSAKRRELKRFMLRKKIHFGIIRGLSKISISTALLAASVLVVEDWLDLSRTVR